MMLLDVRVWRMKSVERTEDGLETCRFPTWNWAEKSGHSRDAKHRAVESRLLESLPEGKVSIEGHSHSCYTRP